MMEATKVLDAKGLACPMPIVKTKKSTLPLLSLYEYFLLTLLNPKL